MTDRITIGIQTAQKWIGQLVIKFMFAPNELSLWSDGMEAGDIRLDPSEKTAYVSLGKADKVDREKVRRAGGAIAKWLSKKKWLIAASILFLILGVHLRQNRLRKH